MADETAAPPPPPPPESPPAADIAKTTAEQDRNKSFMRRVAEQIGKNLLQEEGTSQAWGTQGAVQDVLSIGSNQIFQFFERAPSSSFDRKGLEPLHAFTGAKSLSFAFARVDTGNTEIDHALTQVRNDLSSAIKQSHDLLGQQLGFLYKEIRITDANVTRVNTKISKLPSQDEYRLLEQRIKSLESKKSDVIKPFKFSEIPERDAMAAGTQAAVGSGVSDTFLAGWMTKWLAEKIGGAHLLDALWKALPWVTSLYLAYKFKVNPIEDIRELFSGEIEKHLQRKREEAKARWPSWMFPEYWNIKPEEYLPSTEGIEKKIAESKAEAIKEFELVRKGAVDKFGAIKEEAIKEFDLIKKGAADTLSATKAELEELKKRAKEELESYFTPEGLKEKRDQAKSRWPDWLFPEYWKTTTTPQGKPLSGFDQFQQEMGISPVAPPWKSGPLKPELRKYSRDAPTTAPPWSPMPKPGEKRNYDVRPPTTSPPWNPVPEDFHKKVDTTAPVTSPPWNPATKVPELRKYSKYAPTTSPPWNSVPEDFYKEKRDYDLVPPRSSPPWSPVPEDFYKKVDTTPPVTSPPWSPPSKTPEKRGYSLFPPTSDARRPMSVLEQEIRDKQLTEPVPEKTPSIWQRMKKWWQSDEETATPAFRGAGGGLVNKISYTPGEPSSTNEKQDVINLSAQHAILLQASTEIRIKSPKIVLDSPEIVLEGKIKTGIGTVVTGGGGDFRGGRGATGSWDAPTTPIESMMGTPPFEPLRRAGGPIGDVVQSWARDAILSGHQELVRGGASSMGRGFPGAGPGGATAYGGALGVRGPGTYTVPGSRTGFERSATSAGGRGGTPDTGRGTSYPSLRRGGGGVTQGVNPKLVDVITEAGKIALPPGYTVRIESGVGSRPGGSKSYHPRGQAVDVRIYDEKGNMVGGKGGWYQNAQTFRLYEQLAQAAKKIQTQKYPQESFVWGGYFANRYSGQGKMPYGTADLMHMQWGGQMGGGTWEQGATGPVKQWLDREGGSSIGMGDVAKYELPKKAGEPEQVFGGGTFAGGGATGTWGRSTPTESASSRQQSIINFANKYGMHPTALAGVLQIESGFDPTIQGGAGGNFSGIFQLQNSQIPNLTAKAGFGRLSPEEFRQLSFSDQLKVMDAYYQTHGVHSGFFTGDPKTDSAKAWALQLSPGNAKNIDYSNPHAVISTTAQAGAISSGNIVTVGSAMRETPSTGQRFMGGSYTMASAINLRTGEKEKPVDWLGPTKTKVAEKPAVQARQKSDTSLPTTAKQPQPVSFNSALGDFSSGKKISLAQAKQAGKPGSGLDYLSGADLVSVMQQHLGQTTTKNARELNQWFKSQGIAVTAEAEGYCAAAIASAYKQTGRGTIEPAGKQGYGTYGPIKGIDQPFWTAPALEKAGKVVYEKGGKSQSALSQALGETSPDYEKLDKFTPQAGDIINWPGHVSMATGRVKEVPFDRPWYWKGKPGAGDPYVGARYGLERQWETVGANEEEISPGPYGEYGGKSEYAVRQRFRPVYSVESVTRPSRPAAGLRLPEDPRPTVYDKPFWGTEKPGLHPDVRGVAASTMTPTPPKPKTDTSLPSTATQPQPVVPTEAKIERPSMLRLPPPPPPPPPKLEPRISMGGHEMVINQQGKTEMRDVHTPKPQQEKNASKPAGHEGSGGFKGTGGGNPSAAHESTGRPSSPGDRGESPTGGGNPDRCWICDP